MEKYRYREGDVVGNRSIRLLKPIGIGCSGEVWKAYHEILDKIIALKILRPLSGRLHKYELLGEINAKELFKKDAQNLEKLNKKPHIADFLGAGYIDFKRKSIYIAQEFIDGPNLRDYFLKHGELPIDEITDILMQITEGIQNAHEGGIIHHDLKPGNILIIEKDKYIKLVDFGLSILKPEKIMSGSLPFSSPEAIKRNACFASDLWSEGVVAYWLLTKMIPFRSSIEDWSGLNESERRQQEDELKQAIIHKSPEPARNYNPSVPEDLETIVMKCLEKKLENRYQNAKSLYDDLNGFKNQTSRFFFDHHKQKILVDPKERRELLTKLLHEKIDKWNFPKGEYPFCIGKNETKWTSYPDITWNIGYLCGIYCEAYRITGEKKYLDKAIEQAKSLEDKKTFNETQATGSIFYFSFVQLYDILKREDCKSKYYKKCALDAAESLCSRFDADLKFIRAWDKTGKKGGIELFTSTMFEQLPLLWWVFENADNEEDRKKYRDIAIAQVEATLKYNLKNDSSVYMVSEINIKTRELISHEDDKAGIAREQARGFAGFILAYKYTKNKKYLETAKKIEEQYSKKLEDKIIPPYDFNKPNEIKIDNFAAVTAGLGYDLLSEQDPDENKRIRYRKKMIELSNALWDYVDFEHDYDGIITCAPRDQTNNTNSLINVDYDFLYLQRKIVQIK